MSFSNLWSRLKRGAPRRGGANGRTAFAKRFVPSVLHLEDRDVPNGYLAIGAGPGFLPEVAIRVDIHDALGGSFPNNSGSPATARSDGKTETTSQIFMAYNPIFRGGVNVATGNFDGDYNTPDLLVTAPKAGGGPHVIVWNTQQLEDGSIVVTGIRAQFMAFDFRFTGGVNITCGDLDGDGKAELICAAGPGGGPHVKIFSTDAAGNFFLATEFFAYDKSFRGGVNVGSGQGYNSPTLIEQDIGIRPVGAVQTPYPPGQLIPGAGVGPLFGRDFDPNRLVIFDFFAIAGGNLQYLSGNLLNSYGQIAYRPNIVPPEPNPDNVGRIVFANWANTMPASNYPTDGSAPPTGVPVGPYIQVGATAAGTPIITRLTPGPGQQSSRNQLVTGAGPGGGPHVRVWSFTGFSTAMQANLGKDFFAFDASFRGGVNVAIGDVVSNPSPEPVALLATPTQGVLINVDPSTTLTTPLQILSPPTPINFPIPLIRTPETTGISGSTQRGSIPYSPEVFRLYGAEVIVGMASGGSAVKVFSDFNPNVADPFNLLASDAPAVRMSVSEVNLVPTRIDSTVGTDVTNPLGGFNSINTSTVFSHAIDPQFTGGIVPTVAAFTFEGSANDRRDIGDSLLNDVPITVNPVLGQSVFATGTGFANPSRGPHVRIFNQLGPLTQMDPEYQAVDDINAFPNFTGTGLSVSFGFGVLPNPTLDRVILPTITPGSVSNPILI